MEIEETFFADLKIIHCFRVLDERGIFIKPWLANKLAHHFGSVAETYFSSSERGVLRGLHFQHGDKAQKKLVFCISGEIEDIALDMRHDSDTYGKVFRIKLEGMDGRGVIVPEGFAHGIYAHEPSIIVNFCHKIYHPGNENGFKWDSLTDLSDLQVTILSKKDAQLPAWKETLK